MSDSILMTPVDGPIAGEVRPPGSKSLTNRAVIVAALAEGRSMLRGALDSVDTRVMLDSLQRLGFDIHHDPLQSTIEIDGLPAGPRVDRAELWLENSGTSIRFLTAACATGRGSFRLDGNERMRRRPIGDLADALSALGSNVRCEHDNRCPPVAIEADGLPGGTAQVAGNISSQYLSALLMAAPRARAAVGLRIDGELVSVPYVEMTLAVMRSFGVDVAGGAQHGYWIEPQPYTARDYPIEPDASAASYFFAAAAITGGEVTVPGLSRHALQGDVGFVDILEQMGCEVIWGNDTITVRGRPLRGVDVDMNAVSDTAQTLAAVAVFAEGPTRIRNIAHVRHKETDRIAAVVAELKRLGIHAEEHDDGMTIHPGEPQPAVVETYDDHRMAMSFALIGLRAPGIRISDPQCTAKTYPQFFADFDRLCGRA